MSKTPADPTTQGLPAKDLSARPLDIKHFIEQGQQASHTDPLTRWPRLTEEASPESAGDLARYLLSWAIQGEVKPLPGTPIKHWLHLETDGHLPMTCQRCLKPVDVSLALTRRFAFAADEATAAMVDEEIDDDVLVLDSQFDLAALIEDEWLMSLPLVPMHEHCPDALPTEVVDEGFEAAIQDKPNPFAALAKLRVGPDPDKKN